VNFVLVDMGQELIQKVVVAGDQVCA